MNSSTPACSLLIILLATAFQSAKARPFRPGMMPNGTAVSCAACHVNPAGGGTRTPFGQAVLAIVGDSSATPFWSPALAAQDSDGDGRTNGQELNDPDGDGNASGSSGVTNPGNRPPVFTSAAPSQATRGIAVRYNAAATDAESNAVTFSKVSGPAWLTVSPAGSATGTPPADAPAVVTAVIRVADAGTSTRGSSLAYTEQTLQLSIRSSFAGWQALNFTLPGEAGIAAATADPDNDGISNLEEYARRLNPKSAHAAAPLEVLSVSPSVIQLTARDDDPALQPVLLASDTLDFAGSAAIAGDVSDADPNDGIKRWSFTDAAAAGRVRRFWRVEFRILP